MWILLTQLFFIFLPKIGIFLSSPHQQEFFLIRSIRFWVSYVFSYTLHTNFFVHEENEMKSESALTLLPGLRYQNLGLRAVALLRRHPQWTLLRWAPEKCALMWLYCVCVCVGGCWLVRLSLLFSIRESSWIVFEYSFWLLSLEYFLISFYWTRISH